MENLNDINNLDPNDEGLKAIMGSRFHDATAEPAPAKKAPAPTAKTAESKPEKKARFVPAEALWEPVKEEPTQMDRLKACAKGAAVFSGLGLLFFYWQQAGLMDPAAALPSMLTCTLLTGLSIGKHALK